MTVTELVENFRSALLGLLSPVMRVGIPWKRPEAYDEWDDLATAVYRALVVEPLRSGLPESEWERFGLPDYDLLLPNYAGKSVVELLPAPRDGGVRVFHALGTDAEPFDTVECRPIGPTGLPQTNTFQTIPFYGARFALRVFANGLGAVGVEEIEIVPPKR